MLLFLCLAMLVSNTGALEDLTDKMFTFPEETNTAHVKLNPVQTSPPNTFNAITVCHRTFTDLRRSHSLFSLATPSTFNEFLVFYDEGKGTLTPFTSNIRVDYKGLDYSPNKWYSICTTWDSSTGVMQLWLNGQPLTRKFVTTTPITGAPKIVLGQEQDSHGGGFESAQSFVGMITDVHMWDSELSPCEIQNYVQDYDFTPGNILNWAALDCVMVGNVLLEDMQDCTCN